jgi:hypothetical protein
MSLSEKHKVGSECRIFQDKWTGEYFCVSLNGRALCLICREGTAVLKEYNIVRHYSPSVRYVEMIDSLTEHFKMRLNDFRSHVTNTRIFEAYSPLKSAMLQEN